MGFPESQIKDEGRDNLISREQLINDHLPYVKSIVHRIAAHLPSSVDIEDLINAGVIGLIEAVDRYDPERDNKFMTYAMFRIRGSVISELRSRDFLSRSNRRKLRELEETYLRLEKELGREVDDEEAAQEMNLSFDDFYKIKKMSGISFISLDDIGCFSNEARESLTKYIIHGNKDDALNVSRVKEIEEGIARAIEDLPGKQKMVISLYYWEELTMKEIGKVLDITESRVSQIHSQAVISLRGKLMQENLV